MGVTMLFWAVSTTGVTFTVAVGGGIKGTVLVGEYRCTGSGKGQTCSQYGDFTAPNDVHVRNATMYGFPNDVRKGQRLPAVFVPRFDNSSVYAPNDKTDFFWTIIRYLLGVGFLAGTVAFLVHTVRQWRRVRRGEPVTEFGQVPERQELAPNVLLNARVNEYDWQTHRGREMWRLQLTDDGDHVTWHDGKHTHVWRLPDQSATGVPVLAKAVLLKWGQYQTSLKQPSATIERLVLVDDQDRVLASVLTTHYLTEEDMNRFWPESQFADLTQRGVTYSAETFDDLEQIPQHYRGAVSSVRIALFSRRGAARTALDVGIISAVLVALVVVLYVRRR
jgi:hypothetical protein